MTIKEAKAIDMVNYLSMHGIEPAKVKGNNYWYHSPLRTEKTPSFKINRTRNQWFDFGEGKGGNLLDFVLQWKSCTIPEALEQLSHFPTKRAPLIEAAEPAPAIDILSI